MHMHVIFTYHPFEYPDILRITNLDDQISASFLYLTSEYMVSIFGNPYNMSLHLTDGMTTSSHPNIVTHL